MLLYKGTLIMAIRSYALGRLTVNILPSFGELVTLMSPLFIQRILLTIGSPSPNPWIFKRT
jgi:hypothetical protein